MIDTEVLDAMSKEDWLQWKRNQVTKRVMLYAHMAVQEAKEELCRQAGNNPSRDVYLRGFIDGLTAWLEIEPEEDFND